MLGLGERAIGLIEAHRRRKRSRLPGALGDFYRSGGNAQLYEDLPVATGDRVIDAGGYAGEWTAGMLVRYGCRCELFEPIPEFAEACRTRFRRNALVEVHAAALGRGVRRASFSRAATGSSEFIGEGEGRIELEVVDAANFVERLGDAHIACLKLNIEGGEYDVLEGLLDAGLADRFASFLVQFHRQPEGWEARYAEIESRLAATHERAWCYPMLWEKWVAKATTHTPNTPNG